jgi:antitoxin component HigA of HigAB toxin-antitoxin module
MTPIRNKEEYKAALERVDELYTRSLPEEAEELAQLLELIAYYKKGIIFLKSGTVFENTIYLDFSGVA